MEKLQPSFQLYKEVRALLKRDVVLTIALLLAVVSSCFFRPKLSYIDFSVLGMLLSFMLVVSGFRRQHVLERIAHTLFARCADTRSVAAVLVWLPFFASMLVTNDVSLLIFVPLALAAGREYQMDVGLVVIFQTLAANLGSACTPMGNPQNLFIYYCYQLSVADFFGIMWPLSVLSAAWLAWLIHGLPRHVLALRGDGEVPASGAQLAAFTVLLGVCFLSVLHVVEPLVCTAVVAGAVVLLQPQLFRMVDYSLLATFAGFFIFIGNLSHWEAVQQLHELLLGTRGIVFGVGLLASQFISNVPAAMLLAGFTQNARELLLGVDVGGLGTLIASMASVISYKLYAEAYPHQVMTYLRMFLFYNLAGLICLGTVVYVLLVR